MRIYDLKIEDMQNPLGTDEKKPAFSWKMQSCENGAKQTSYRITVCDSRKNTVWDSGVVMSDKSVYVEYDGLPICAREQYFVNVTVHDNNGNSSEAEAWFETGLMGEDEEAWDGAKWIGSPTETVNTAAVDCYRISGTYTSEKLGLAINARNKDNYVLIDIEEGAVTVYEISDNAWNNGKSYKKVLGRYDYNCKGARHSFILDVDRRSITLVLDGAKIIENDTLIPDNPPNQPRKTYLMSVGFNQMNSAAVVENLKIECGSMMLYEEERIRIENAFELICPVGAVNVRRFFLAQGKIRSARLYASARGFYEAYINGRRVGESYYNPGFTDYRLRIQYQTFDVTDMVLRGENVIGAVVGKGHYSGFCGYSGSMVYGRENSFLAKLVIEYEDGREQTVVTDEDWQFTDRGPLVDSDYFDGETYDARLEYDWSDMSDTRWKKCGVKEWNREVIPTNGTLENVKFRVSAQKGSMAEAVKIIKGRFCGETPKGRFVYDMRQNMVGTVRIRFRGVRGMSVKVRYGEMTYKDGSIYIQNLRSAANTDVYTMKGKDEVFEPSFTSHGFRYVEISGCGCEISEDMVVSVEGIVISNVGEITGEFECSNSLVNKLQNNIQWGQRGNSLLVLTDCPQRNERMGWTGDAQVFARTGAYNMNTKSFTEKWLTDLADAQLMFNRDGAVPDTAPLGGDNRREGCAGWGDAAVIAVWELYRAYGDKRLLEKYYDMMSKWVEYQSRDDRQNYGLRVVDGILQTEKSDFASIPYIQVQQPRGDHLTFDNSTPYIYSATAYAAHVADIMSRAAKILGKAEDEKKYRERFCNIKRAFNEAWVCEDGSVAYWGEASAKTPHSGDSVAADGSVTRYTRYSDEENSEHHPSQTSYALAIDFGLIPSEKLPRAAQCFKNTITQSGGTLTTGFLGISHLAPALSKAGLEEEAFALLEQEENPSWLYSVKNGATTIWERWNSYIAETGEFGDVSMNSFNHYSYGAIGEWLFGRVLGIIPQEAGYKSFMLLPVWGGSLTYAKGFHICPYGKIESSWEIKDGVVKYSCTVPPNTEATLCLPKREAIKLTSGKYEFTVE